MTKQNQRAYYLTTSAGTLPRRSRRQKPMRELSLGVDVLAPTVIVYILSLLVIGGLMVLATMIIEDVLQVSGLRISGFRAFLLSMGMAGLPASWTFASSWRDFQDRSAQVIATWATDYQDLPDLSRVKPIYGDQTSRTHKRLTVGKFDLTTAEWQEWADRIRDNNGKIVRDVLDFTMDGANRVFPNLTDTYPQHRDEMIRLGWIDDRNQMLTDRGREWFYNRGWTRTEEENG